MSILTERLPETVEVDGDLFDIDTDFSTILQIIEALSKENTTQEDIFVALYLFYKGEIPEKTEESINPMLDFIAGEKENNKSNNNYRSISLIKGADLIFSAFYRTYNIDLTKTNLHWYKFKSLLSDLDSNCNLIKYTEILNKDTRKIKDSKERYQIEKAQRELIKYTDDIKTNSIQSDILDAYYKKGSE